MKRNATPPTPPRKRVAITGGIGSGKSFVCQLLLSRGIKVYDCDEAAKRLMRDDAQVRNALRQLVGDEVYQGHVLQKHVMAQFILESEANKQAVNAIVHPAVARDFEQSEFTWLESAILFDSKFHLQTRFDHVVCVTAPNDLRIERIMQRDHISRQQALQWIERQLPQDEVRSLSDFEIVNDGQHDLDQQIDNIIKQINQS